MRTYLDPFGCTLSRMDETLSEALSAVLRAEAADRRQTTVGIAARTEYSAVAIGRYLRGERVIPMDAVEQIANALGCKVSVLMERAEARLRHADPTRDTSEVVNLPSPDGE